MRSDIEKIFYLGRHLQGFDWNRLKFIEESKFTNDKETNLILDEIVDTMQNKECITKSTVGHIVNRVNNWKSNKDFDVDVDSYLINSYFDTAIYVMAKHIEKDNNVEFNNPSVKFEEYPYNNAKYY